MKVNGSFTLEMPHFRVNIPRYDLDVSEWKHHYFVGNNHKSWVVHRVVRWLCRLSHCGWTTMLSVSVRILRFVQGYKRTLLIGWVSDFSFFFSFGVPQLMLPEAPQPCDLLHYPPYWTFKHSAPVPRCHSS
jgi:hypothetical protein